MRHLLELLVNPFLICLILLGISTYYLWRQKNMRFVKIACSIALLGLYSISTFLPYELTNYLEDQYEPIMQVDHNVKWVVVLGGGKSDILDMPANIILSSASIVRLFEGVRLFNLLPHANLVLSGGSGGGNKSEAELFNELTSWFAIPKERIILEPNSNNTAGQARGLMSIVHQQPFYLVTSANHMPRAMALCRQLGLSPIAAPSSFLSQGSPWVGRFIPSTSNVSNFYIVFHEILGYLWARLSSSS